MTTDRGHTTTGGGIHPFSVRDVSLAGFASSPGYVEGLAP